MAEKEIERPELKRRELGFTITKTTSDEKLYSTVDSLSKLNVKSNEFEANPLSAGRKLEAVSNFEKLKISKEDVVRNLMYATESIRQ
jgi:hypothetical protein